MRLDNKKNVKRNIAWGIINKVINILLPFFTRTIIIYELGVNYIGLGSLFSAILSTLSLAELGFDTGIVTIMYKSVAENDKDKLSVLLNFIKKAYLVVGITILLLGSFCIPFIHLLIKEKDAIPEDINIYILFIIYLLNTVTTYFFGGYRNCVLEAYQRQDVVSNINSINKIFLFIIQFIVLLLTKNFYAFSICMVIFGILNNILTYAYVSKNYSDIVPKGKLSIEERNTLKKILSGTFLSKLGTVLGNTFDSIVISTFLGITLLGYYSNYSYIITSIQGFLAVIIISLQAGIGNSVALDSIEKNHENMDKYTFVYSWILGWCTLCLMYLISPFIDIWVGEKGLLPEIIVFLSVLCFYVSNCFAIIGTYKNAIGIWWEDRYRCLICGIANLVINISLVLILNRFGEIYSLCGVVVSTILTTGFIGIPWAAKVTFDLYFKKGLKNYICDLIKYMGVTYFIMILCFPAMFFLSEKYLNNKYLVFISRGFFLCVIPNILYFIIYKRNQHMLFFMDLIKKRLKIINVSRK